MNSAIPLMLGRDDVVEGRLFAHPDHITSDRSTLCMLMRDIHRRISGHPDPIDAWEPNPEDWYRHVIVPRPEAFADHERLTVVGFFGRKRDVVPLEVARAIQDLSAELDRCIPEFPSVLSYSTQLLSDENNYANLVLMDSPDAIWAWRNTAPHPAAAGEVSKSYYAFVRIYHGWIDTSAMAVEGAVRLDRVRYWDYRSDPTWMAQRELALP